MTQVFTIFKVDIVSIMLIDELLNISQAHKAIAEFEQRLKKEGRHVIVITQNIDELHQRAGTENILELHGSLFRTRCLKCRKIEPNYDSPICEALRGKG